MYATVELMAEINGVTRREFDRLQARVDDLFREGSPQVRDLRRELATEVRHIAEEVHDLKEETNRRFSSQNKILTGILFALLAGLISLLTALGSGALG